MYLPSDGPAPALVTYERRPFASVSGVPSRERDRLAAERVALARRSPRRVVVDRERAEDRGRLLLAVAQVRLLADEVLLLHLRPLHAGLDDVVLGLELGAVGAVALLEPPGRAVDADPAGRQAVRLRRPPRARPRAARPARSARRAPSRGRRRRRCARRARAASRSRSSGRCRTGSPRARRRRR